MKRVEGSCAQAEEKLPGGAGARRPRTTRASRRRAPRPTSSDRHTLAGLVAARRARRRARTPTSACRCCGCGGKLHRVEEPGRAPRARTLKRTRVCCTCTLEGKPPGAQMSGVKCRRRLEHSSARPVELQAGRLPPGAPTDPCPTWNWATSAHHRPADAGLAPGQAAEPRNEAPTPSPPPPSWLLSATSRASATCSDPIAYLGLDPRVRQSGDHPARPGRISKRASASRAPGVVRPPC